MVALRNRVFRGRKPDDYEDLDWLYAERADSLIDDVNPSTPSVRNAERAPARTSPSATI